MKFSDGTKYSSCLFVAVSLWLKSPKHRKIKCKSQGIFLPPHFFVETDTGYQIHWKMMNKDLKLRNLFWFKGKIQKRWRKRLDKSAKSDNM